jgi:nitrogen regulatory protein P-II 1
MILILFVLNDSDKLSHLLDAWEAAGIRGATILHSSGLGRVRQHAGLMDDLPLMPSLEALLQHEEFFSRTLFTVVDDETVGERILKVTEQVVGSLDRPGSGLLLMLPVLNAYGLNNKASGEE